MKKILCLLLALCLTLPILTACGSGNGKTPVSGKKVAYIMHMAESEIFGMWSDSAKETAEALGMEYEAVFCNDSDELWKSKVEEYAEKGYDGLLLSHGGQDYAYSFLKDILARYPDLKIVTFDTQFVDAEGKTQTLDGVTQFFQEDAKLSEMLLDYVCDTLYADKTAAGEPVNILKVWKGPNYITAFDRRQVGYEQYEQSGKIHTVETIAPAQAADAEASMKQVAADTLAKYQNGEIDAIWCCYDLYASGVYAALKESGCDIPMVSVDICNADIAKMAEAGSNWKACATTNWNFNGEFGMRALALEIAGEYDKIIDPVSDKASAWIEIPVCLITSEMLESDSTVNDLASVAGEDYNDRSYMLTADWMK